MNGTLPVGKSAELVRHQEHVFSRCASIHPATATSEVTLLYSRLTLSLNINSKCKSNLQKAEMMAE